MVMYERGKEGNGGEGKRGCDVADGGRERGVVRRVGGTRGEKQGR